MKGMTTFLAYRLKEPDNQEEGFNKDKLGVSPGLVHSDQQKGSKKRLAHFPCVGS